MNRNVNYIIEKLKSYSLSEILLSEMESYVSWLFRHIPGFLGIFLRFIIYKLLFKKLDSFCLIQPNVYFVHCAKIKIGKNFAVNSNTYINGIGQIDIGDNVLIGPNVVASSGEHPYFSKQPVNLLKIKKKKITIEDEVWIGANVVIMPGIRIAKGTIVGAGSVVTKSTDPYSIVGGIPAKKIKSRI